MKIILVNYRYFISGGPERYLFNITDILEHHGHTVIPFSIRHNKNKPTPYESSFLDPIGSGDEVYAHEYKKKGPATILKAVGRLLYSFEAKRKLKKLIRAEKPDLVYVLYYQNKLSCSIIDAAWEMKVPVVQRISDFGHICVNNTLFNFKENKVCERCLHGSRFNAIRYKCMSDSYAQSFMKVMALTIQDFRKTRQKISAFVIPTPFTASRFREYGVPGEKIHVIPTFFNPANDGTGQISYGDFFLYVGRVDKDKGIMTMAKAFCDTPYKLIVIGSSVNGYDEEIKEYLRDKKHNIRFLGQQDFSVIRPYLDTCLCTICPSVWYDNMPNAVLESYASAKSVIASRLGSFLDLVEDHKTGLLFNPGDHEDLRNKLTMIADNSMLASDMGRGGKELLKTRFSEKLHYNELNTLFHQITEKAGT